MKPYEALANAIIVQACDDYRNALLEKLRKEIKGGNIKWLKLN